MLLADMTFHQFLQNPTGPYSAFFGKRENIKLDLETRFNKLLGNTKHKEFNHTVYKSGNDYYFHIKIPSEKFNNIFYDVVIQLVPNSSSVLTEGTLLNYNLKFFSNSPAFVYTYAYVSKKDKLLIQSLQNKINPTALTTPPSVKNPIEIYGFEKSIYFALLYIKYKNYHVKTAISASIKSNNNISSINSKCKHSDIIMKEYNLEKQKEKLKKDKDKQLAKQQKIKDVQAQRKAEREAKNASRKNKVIKPKRKI